MLKSTKYVGEIVLTLVVIFFQRNKQMNIY